LSSEPVSVWRRRLTGVGDPLSRQAGLLFMIGSTCFALGSFPPYFANVPGRLVGVTFFVGSVFFTSAGITQWLQLHRDPPGDRKVIWAVVVQLVGMVFFNINTFRAAFLSVSADQVNQLIWAPDFYGSIAFLVASHLAWLAVCGGLWCVDRASADWWMAALNYVGSIFFMLSALAAFTVPTTGDVINIRLVNLGTLLGALCFFLGAYLLLPVAKRRVAS
jgi:hypothetical protein